MPHNDFFSKIGTFADPTKIDIKKLRQKKCTMCGASIQVKEILHTTVTTHTVKVKCTDCGIEWSELIYK